MGYVGGTKIGASINWREKDSAAPKRENPPILTGFVIFAIGIALLALALGSERHPIKGNETFIGCIDIPLMEPQCTF